MHGRISLPRTHSVALTGRRATKDHDVRATRGVRYHNFANAKLPGGRYRLTLVNNRAYLVGHTGQHTTEQMFLSRLIGFSVHRQTPPTVSPQVTYGHDRRGPIMMSVMGRYF